MWIGNDCPECGNKMALNVDIILDAAIDRGGLTIEARTTLKDIKLREVLTIRELFDDVLYTVIDEMRSEIIIDALRDDLIHKYRFSLGLVDEFLEELKVKGNYYENRGKLLAVN